MLLISRGDLIPEPLITNAYMVKLEFMHGDADDYSDHTYGPFDDKTLKDANGLHLEDLLRAIHAVKDADERDLDTMQEQIPGWALLREEWHYEQGSHGEYRASYDGHTMTQFDEHGREYSTKFELS